MKNWIWIGLIYCFAVSCNKSTTKPSDPAVYTFGSVSFDFDGELQEFNTATGRRAVPGGYTFNVSNEELDLTVAFAFSPDVGPVVNDIDVFAYDLTQEEPVRLIENSAQVYLEDIYESEGFTYISGTFSIAVYNSQDPDIQFAFQNGIFEGVPLIREKPTNSNELYTIFFGRQDVINGPEVWDFGYRQIFRTKNYEDYYNFSIDRNSEYNTGFFDTFDNIQKASSENIFYNPTSGKISGSIYAKFGDLESHFRDVVPTRRITHSSDSCIISTNYDENIFTMDSAIYRSPTKPGTSALFRAWKDGEQIAVITILAYFPSTESVYETGGANIDLKGLGDNDNLQLERIWLKFNADSSQVSLVGDSGLRVGGHWYLQSGWLPVQ